MALGDYCFLNVGLADDTEKLTDIAFHLSPKIIWEHTKKSTENTSYRSLQNNDALSRGGKYLHVLPKKLR